MAGISVLAGGKSTKQLKIFLFFRRAFSAISLRAKICCTVLMSFRNPACSSAMCSSICEACVASYVISSSDMIAFALFHVHFICHCCASIGAILKHIILQSCVATPFSGGKMFNEIFVAICLQNASVKNCENSLTNCLLYTSPSPRDRQKSRMPSSA